MKQLTILVDMDDTIECLCEAWIEWLNAKHGLDVSVSAVNAWDINSFYPELSKEEVFAPLSDPDFWDTVKPREDAQEYLRRLKDSGHKVYVVTASFYKTIIPKVEKVLFKYFPYITWDDVIVTSRKQLLTADVLIDDAPHNLEGGDYFKILVDAPHNRSYDAAANDMLRVKSWEQIYALVNYIASTEKRG